MRPYCPECGTPTITTCPSCGKPIRGAKCIRRYGRVWVSNEASQWTELISRLIAPPSFCSECGTIFPWTSASLHAANDLADELDDLNHEERELLKRSIEDVVRDSPNTNVAVTRIKKLAMKAGSGTLNVLRPILTSVATEAARKLLFP
jgi:hypothetical protein